MVRILSAFKNILRQKFTKTLREATEPRQTLSKLLNGLVLLNSYSFSLHFPKPISSFALAQTQYLRMANCFLFTLRRNHPPKTLKNLVIKRLQSRKYTAFHKKICSDNLIIFSLLLVGIKILDYRCRSLLIVFGFIHFFFLGGDKNVRL